MNDRNPLKASQPLDSGGHHVITGLSPTQDEETDTNNNNKTRRRIKHVSRACNPCRRKKTRCDGERPTCAPCVTYHDECTYDTAQDRRRPVSKAYVTALEGRVAWLERMLEEHAGPDVGSGEREGEGEVDIAGDNGEEGWPGASKSSSPERRPMGSNGKASLERLQIDNATGEVREYGPTSVFKHLPTADLSPISPTQSGTSVSNTNSTRLENDFALDLPDAFDEGTHQEVLRVFFAFFNPWCLWVDEEQFRNDMEVSTAEAGSFIRRHVHTAYYSPLLHFAILAIGTMYLKNGTYHNRELLSDLFARNAATFFEEEIETAKLSTVVGLMMLGTHHAGHARQSLGYIYSGTGLRLTRILGLGVDTSVWVDKGLISLEMKRSRDRVFHTSYIQDKLWSTYVGRPPSPNLSHLRMPFPTIDDEKDATPWNGLDGSGSEPSRQSWLTSTFTWTCKLARIIDLILTIIYSTRRNMDSEKARNSNYELSVLLEKWVGEVPEHLRVDPTILRSQSAPIMLPHVIVMNVMFYFAVILLNRPNYCDTSKPSKRATKTPSATMTITATERCNQAAENVLRLAEVFDVTFGLRYAPVSMTQFIFTAGTIHLLSAANGKNVESDAASVHGCIAALQSMGQTWKCASQSGDVLQRLLQEWHPKLAHSEETSSDMNASNGRDTNQSSEQAQMDIEEMLQQNPEMAQQLQRLGWAPPKATAPSSSFGLTHNLETLLTSSNYTQTEKPDTIVAQQPLVFPETGTNDNTWMPQTSGWTNHTDGSTLPPNQEQSLFEMLMDNDWIVPEAWTNRIFDAEMGGS